MNDLFGSSKELRKYCKGLKRCISVSAELERKSRVQLLTSPFNGSYSLAAAAVFLQGRKLSLKTSDRNTTHFHSPSLENLREKWCILPSKCCQSLSQYRHLPSTHLPRLCSPALFLKSGSGQNPAESNQLPKVTEIARFYPGLVFWQVA